MDHWYRAFLAECRVGAFSDEMYHYILGLPTEHAGSWTGAVGAVGTVACGSAACSELPRRWATMARWGNMEDAGPGVPDLRH